MALLREQGYTPNIVEHYNAYAHVTKDLFGFIDIVALHPHRVGVTAVQTTTASNLAAREAKARLLPAYRLWLECGNIVAFHGWRKVGERGKRKTWQALIRVVTLHDLEVEDLLS